MKALILAGGYATRLWPLTKERPKPLLLMNGKAIITHIVNQIPKEIEVWVSTNQKFKRDFVEWKRTVDRDINLIIEETETEDEKVGAIGSIQGFIKTYNVVDDLLVIAGDNFFHFKIKDFLKHSKGLPLIAAHNIKRYLFARKYGVLQIRGDKVISFEEKPEEPKSTLVSTGVYVLPASIFNVLDGYLRQPSAKKDNLGSFIEYLVKKTEVKAYVFEEGWFDIGSFEGYLEAHKNQTRVRRKKGEGPFFGVDFVGTVVLKGSVFIDKGSLVKDSIIEDSIILNDCEIRNSHVRNCIVDVNSSIVGSYTNHELIETDSRIRNFRKDKLDLDQLKGV